MPRYRRDWTRDFPELFRIWDSSKNDKLLHTYLLKDKVWWLCDKGHSYQETIKNAILRKTKGCQKCNGDKRILSEKRNLACLYPDLLKEWDIKKNEGLDPFKILPGVSLKVWWVCGRKHSFFQSISSRVRGAGCPYCANFRASPENNLGLHPVSQEFHPTKNNLTNPSDFTISSSKKVWWLCSKGHSFYQSISARTSKHESGCPYCANFRASSENNLGLHPVSKEFHPTKNHPFSVQDFTQYSTKKIWWLCPKGHEFQAVIKQRTRLNTQCGFCRRNFSKIEVYVYSELNAFFKNVVWSKKHFGKEIDIFLPDHNIGVEIDGVFWHKNKIEKDREKNLFFKEKGIRIIRLRESPLPLLSPEDIPYSIKYSNFNPLGTIKKTLITLGSLTNTDVSSYLNRNSLLCEKESLELLNTKKTDILIKHPHLLLWWHPTKNNNLRLDCFKSSSTQKVWWVCPKGHAFYSMIASRAQGHGCPVCRKEIMQKTREILLNLKRENNLNISEKHPHLKEWWHPSKNKPLELKDIVDDFTRKVWWVCPRGHEFYSKFLNRVKGHGCPLCDPRTRKQYLKQN